MVFELAVLCCALLENFLLTVPTELFERENFKRMFTAFCVFTAQQATGATVCWQRSFMVSLADTIRHSRTSVLNTSNFLSEQGTKTCFSRQSLVPSKSSPVASLS